MKSLFVALALILALSSGSFADQVLLNRGFEDSTGHGNYWTVSGIPIDQYANAWMVPGQCPATTGPWGLDLVNNYGISDGTCVQTYYTTPGQYTVTGSGWFRAFSGVGTGTSYARIRIRVDGVKVSEVTLNGVNGAWTDWTKLDAPAWTGQVNSSVEFRIALHADGQGGWGQVVGDQMRMDVTAVPEPASILALVAGLGGLVIRRRK